MRNLFDEDDWGLENGYVVHVDRNFSPSVRVPHRKRDGTWEVCANASDLQTLEMVQPDNEPSRMPIEQTFANCRAATATVVWVSLFDYYFGEAEDVRAVCEKENRS